MPATLDFQRARANMVEQQIRTWEVLDQGVLDLLHRVKREDFVPPAYRELAFAEIEIPMGHGQHMLSPKVEARIVQEVGIQPGDRVLQVGVGSGYLAALLAQKARRLRAIEYFPELVAPALARLKAAGVHHVEMVSGDAATGPAELIGTQPYEVIVITGSTPELPPKFLAALAPGGRLFAVTGTLPVMTARLYTKRAAGQVGQIELFETVLTPLVNALSPARFRF